MELDEKILVQQLKTGNKLAFNHLFYRYYQQIYNFVLNLVKQTDTADCLVQECFINIWELRETLDETLPFKNYLYRAAKNRALNSIRKNVNMKAYCLYLEKNAKASEHTTENEIRFKELENTILKCMNELPARRREIFELSINEGLTYKEIAEKLNISENTVDTQIRNALNYLRSRISQLINFLIFFN